MKKIILRIFTVLFLLLLCLSCVLLIVSLFLKDSIKLFNVIDTSNTEFRILYFIAAACALSFMLIFIAFLIFRQNGSPKTQTFGKLVSLITAGFAISISITAAVILLIPSKSYNFDFEINPSEYVLLNEYKPPRAVEYPSPAVISIIANTSYDNKNDRNKVSVRVSSELENSEEYTVTSVRIIVVGGNGQPYGAYVVPIPSDGYPFTDFTKETKIYNCYFPRIKEKDKLYFEMYYKDRQGNICCECESVLLTD